jgi:hypothetical protein
MQPRGDGDWSKRPLRVGLLISSFSVSRWIHDAVHDLRTSGIADIVLVIKREDDVSGASPSLLRRIVCSRSRLLYTLYSKLDRFIFNAEPDPFTSTDIQPLVGNCPVLRVTPITTRHSDYFTDADVDAIATYDLDVAVLLGSFRILRGRALQIARYGVWSYHHGDNLTNRGVPEGFWEVMEGAPVTGSILRVLDEDLGGGHVLYRSYSKTDARSVVRNRRRHYWKSSAFLLRKLRDLYREGPDSLRETSGADAHPAPYSHRLYSVPTNSEMSRLLLRLVGRLVRDKLTELLWWEQWFMAYRISTPTAEEAGRPDLIPYRFKTLVPPRDRFWADPCAVKEGDRYFIFFEEWIYGRPKAHISVMEVDKSGPAGDSIPVLEPDYHLSHPFLFEWEGTHYLIPESAENRTVELYRAMSFPDKWELAGVLLTNVRAADATVACLGNLWWMFVTIGGQRVSKNDELHLFFAEKPLGPWQPHRRNPVKSDVRSARPAGGVFRWAGHYYRPSQDCSTTYGHAIVLNRIETIDPANYHETEVARITPTWRPRLSATHTINAVAGLTVIDGCMRKPRFFW